MTRFVKVLLRLSAVSIAFCTACAAPPVATATSESAGLFPTDRNAVIDALAGQGGTRAMRLRPETIRAMLRAQPTDVPISLTDDGKLFRSLELQFIHDPKTSTLDLLGPELSEHFRQFAWDPADYPGGAEGPNEKLADVMVDALDLVRAERRVNTSRDAIVLKSEATEEVWTYMEKEWVPVPGQEDRKLNRYALESFVRMRDAAKKEGVDLIILSSERSRAKAEANAARANNVNAVASFSAHSLGLAIDFQMSQGEFQIEEITTKPMSEVVRMRESPVHKWLFLRGEEFGWYPYQNEPWHWEYNPDSDFRNVYFKNFPGGAPKRTIEQ